MRLFADDALLYLDGEDFEAMLNTINQELTVASKWQNIMVYV